MKAKDVFRPANSRLILADIVNPIYMSREQWKTAAIPMEYWRRIIIVDFIEEEKENGK